MNATPSFVRRRSTIMGSVTLLGLSLAALPAQARDELSVDLSARAGVSTNPFLESGPTPLTGTLTLGIRPSWVNQSELTTLQISGYAETSFYTRDYGTNGNVTVQGSGTHRLSERTSLSASLGYVNTIVGSFNGFGGPIVTVAPVTGTLPTAGTAPVTGPSLGPVAPTLGADLPYVITDPSLGRIGRRQRVYLASGELATALSERDQLSFSLSSALNRGNGFDGGVNGFNGGVNGFNGGDFNTVTPGVSYSRVLGERFSVGARFTAGFTDYLGTDLGDATVYQPALTLTRGVGDRWTLTGSLGAAITELKGFGGDNRSTVTLNGTADLCRQDERWSACFNASRQTVPSTFQGLRTQTTAGASGSYRLSARDDLSFSGSYSYAGDPIQPDVIGTRDGSVDFVTASGSYSRRIGPALFATATLGYAKALDDFQQRDANFTALAGVTYRLGRQR